MMREWARPIGFIGSALTLVFWLVVPATTFNTYLHPGQEPIYVVFVVLALCGIVGAFLVRSHGTWAAALMAVAAIPGVTALIVPGLLLLVAALMSLQQSEPASEPPAAR